MYWNMRLVVLVLSIMVMVGQVSSLTLGTRWIRAEEIRKRGGTICSVRAFGTQVSEVLSVSCLATTSQSLFSTIEPFI